ncbi:hypothetical protein FVE85_9311 [Porphyridium purpureum]|uniref:Large ribosomal subunit protein bL32m n=1 Tax=Porphyridium purpureum TaxID=35688 RepID=A0A5J4YNN6_PORPP|nr:hypothetical protein FVE85_9311 [Porphyridium purpureum]|eukprot:POR7804..scf222_8
MPGAGMAATWRQVLVQRGSRASWPSGRLGCFRQRNFAAWVVPRNRRRDALGLDRETESTLRMDRGRIACGGSMVACGERGVATMAVHAFENSELVPAAPHPTAVAQSALQKAKSFMADVVASWKAAAQSLVPAVTSPQPAVQEASSRVPGIFDSLLDGWVLGVPKKRRSKRTVRMRHKAWALRPQKNIVKCLTCGRAKLPGRYCDPRAACRRKAEEIHMYEARRKAAAAGQSNQTPPPST